MTDDLPPIKPISLHYQIGTTVQRMKLTAGVSTLTVLGEDIRTGKKITVEDEMRERGMYVVGVQGTGKSSFLEALIHQDICKGYPVIVIDPHGDLVDHVIAQMPEKRVKDTYLLDIENTKYPFGINLFAAPANANQGEITRAVERLMHVFERVFPIAARMLLDKYLENIALVFLENPGYTMADIPRFLTNDELRHELIKHLSNDYVREFWLEFDSLAPGRKREEVNALSNRLNSFLNKPMVRNIVGQKTSTIDVRRAIQQHEILLVKLPVKEYKNIATLIGTMLISLIHAATFSFRNIPRAKRPGFSLFVDEFQNFATLDYAELFTEARKYKARQTIAHQHTKQINLEELKEATTTAHTIIAFQTSGNDARIFAPIFSDLERYPGIQHIYRDVLPRLKHHKNRAVTDFWARYIRRWEEADNKEPKTRREEGYEYKIWPSWNLGFGIVEYHPNQVRAALSVIEEMFYGAMLNKELDDEITQTLVSIESGTTLFSEWYTEEQLQYFVQHLKAAMTALVQEPIGESNETTINDIADLLHHLPKYTALVRVGEETHHIKPPPIPVNTASSDNLWQRVRTIQIQTGKKYGRKREEVEKELAAKQRKYVSKQKKEEAEQADWNSDGEEEIEKPVHRPRFEDVEDI